MKHHKWENRNCYGRNEKEEKQIPGKRRAREAYRRRLK
jgi:hypothetical protein